MSFLKKIESPGAIALLAGIACYTSAFVVIVGLPSWLTNQDEASVIGYDGVQRDVRDYTAAEARGRETYGNQVCFHCHSQFVRPVNDEYLRWGPVSQTGEYAHDRPHFFGTRRTGPDLHREGLLRVDDWHLAHFANPRFTVPHSVMPGFTWLFRPNPKHDRVAKALALLDTNGDGMISTSLGDPESAPAAAAAAAVAEARAWLDDKNPSTRIDRRGLRGPPLQNAIDGKTSDSIWFDESSEAGENVVTDYDGAELPTNECNDLVTYVQRLGTSIGMWRRPITGGVPARASPFDGEPLRPRKTDDMRVYGHLAQNPERVKKAEDARAKWAKNVAAWDAEHPLLAERLVKGKDLFAKHCAGCHGDEGRGNGNAARFMLTRPRDFTMGKYKFRSTFVGSLPLDGDLYRTIFRGLPGSAMPPWRELSDEQIWLLVDFVKSLYEDDGSHHFNDRMQVAPTTPEHFDPDPMAEVMRGRAVYLTSAAQCSKCHGTEGRGDGDNWNNQANQYGGAMRPRDFRPRIALADAEELYGLMGRKIERYVGVDAWKTLSKAAKWVALSPTDSDATKATEKRKAFVLFLLGEGPRVVEAFGEEAVKTALGDRYESLFKTKDKKGDDPLETLRMSVAIEKDQPALRMRNGVLSEDLYRLVMTGIEGTAMKATFDTFWTKKNVDGRDKWHKPESRTEAKFEWVPLEAKDKDGKPVFQKFSKPSGDARLKENAGVTIQKNAKGEDEEGIFIQPGDDWALVHYIQWLMCVPRERTGN